MASSRPRVFTIPPSVPFLPTLIAALVDGRLVPGFHPKDDPLALAAASLYLPTRRACRLARDIFLDALGQDAALLPRLTAIGDIDEDELIFAEAAGPLGAMALDLPPAIGGLERRLLLAQLVLKWAQSKDVRGAGDTPLVANTPTAALALADALARLIDDMTTRGVAWERLDSLVPDHVDTYWQLTLSFLKIAREHWPALLAERGAIEPAARRDRLIAAEAARLAGAQAGPVIAAGSTGSMPATAALLATIARLPHGAVVLPGLDTWLDEPSWGLIAGERAGRPGAGAGAQAAMPAFGHPQFAMRALLAGLGMTREEVVLLAPPAAHGRDALVSEALRPAGATELWSETIARGDFGAALKDVAVIEAANAEEEALAIAVALREAVERRDVRCALVTPDRALARRVVAALGRWNVAVDDSGGDALADTPAGAFARLAAEAALGGLEPVTLLALLKHPLFRLGRAKASHTAAISILERALLRGPRPRGGSAGLAQAFATFKASREQLHASDRRRTITEDQLDRTTGFVSALAAALAPLETVGRTPQPLAVLVERHRAVVFALMAGDDGSLAGASEDAGVLLGALDAIAANEAAAGFAIAPRDFAEMLPGLLDDSVRRPLNADARVRIFGLLEARLQPVDRIVLGGLTEGIWPPQTRSDPWLSRPMRHQLGLDLPERRIGLTAHDFAQAMGASEVILTRADKVAGAPTVASRFVRRLAAVAGEARWNAARDAGRRYIAWARALDRPAEVTPIKPPEPKPPLSARPTRLSVTEIEHWLRDPYTIYAKHILRLEPLDAVDTPPGARDRGSAIHAAIEQFTKDFAAGLPPDPLPELLRIGRETFAPLGDYPEAKAFWWPRFERIARWLVDWERRRRGDIEAVFAEVRGEIAFPLGERTFTLTTRIDRIEQTAPGTYALIDYKTGSVATKDQVRSGLAPQLTLEAAIVQHGRLTDVARGEVDAFNYLRLRGGEPAGVEHPIVWRDTTPAAEAARALAKLRQVIERFEDVATPYRALTNPMWKSRYGDYDHLARVKEWLDPDTDEWAT